MRTSVRAFLAIALALALAACASSGTAMRSAAPQTLIAQDGVYVAAVETIAKKRGVRVHWVNPPLKRQQVVAQAK